MLNNNSRRQFLNAMGLGSSTLFLPSLFGDKLAQGQGNVPKRLFVYFTPHGPVQQKCTMRANGPGGWNGATKADAAMNLSFQLPQAQSAWSEILKPLSPLSKKLLVLEGLSMTSALLDKETNNHNAGTSHSLTGAKMTLPGGFNREGGGGGSSLDQVVADLIADPNRIRSLYYTTGGWSPIFRGAAEQGGISSPGKAFDKLFPVSVSGDPTADAVKKQRKSALTLVKGEYQKLVTQLSGDDKVKLQNHFDLVSDLEKQFIFKSTAQCTSRPATRPSDDEAPKTMGIDFTKPIDQVPLVGRPTVTNFGNILAAALACDMTRVGVLVNSGYAEQAALLNVHTDLHLDIAHNANPGNVDAYGKMTRYYASLAKEFADILAKFDSIPVDGGKTLLDQTMCVWLCELANGAHALHDMSAVVAGGNDWSGFSMGRYVKYAETLPHPRGGGPNVGPAHNKLLTSVAQAFGSTKGTFGLDNTTGKALAKETGHRAESVDLEGGLTGLKV
jgi:hypothetical protein